MQRVAVVPLIGALVLSGCGALEPKGTITVTFQPSTASPSTTVIGPDFKYIGTFEGNFAASVPAGRFSITTSAPGFDTHRQEGTIGAGEAITIDVQLLEVLRAEYSYFTVTRYDEARVTMYGLHSSQDIGSLTVRARCVEDGYPNLETYFARSVVLAPDSPRDVLLLLTSGFPYFTSNTVRCSFWGEAGDRDVAITKGW